MQIIIINKRINQLFEFCWTLSVLEKKKKKPPPPFPPGNRFQNQVPWNEWKMDEPQQTINDEMRLDKEWRLSLKSPSQPQILPIKPACPKNTKTPPKENWKESDKMSNNDSPLKQMRPRWSKSRHSHKTRPTASRTPQTPQRGTPSWGIDTKHPRAHLACPIPNPAKITSARPPRCTDELHGPTVVPMKEFQAIFLFSSILVIRSWYAKKHHFSILAVIQNIWD